MQVYSLNCQPLNLLVEQRFISPIGAARWTGGNGGAERDIGKSFQCHVNVMCAQRVDLLVDRSIPQGSYIEASQICSDFNLCSCIFTVMLKELLRLFGKEAYHLPARQTLHVILEMTRKRTMRLAFQEQRRCLRDSPWRHSTTLAPCNE